MCRLYWAVAEYRNVCYLIHFDEPVYKTGQQHYLGFSTSLPERIERHRTNKGSAITARANKLGIGWRVVRVWRDADLDAERALKSFVPKNLCPHCNVKVRLQRARAEKIESGQGRPQLLGNT